MSKSLSPTTMTLWFLGALFVAAYTQLQPARPQLAFYDAPSRNEIFQAMRRYVQSDRIGLAGTVPGTLSTYAYVGNNPLYSRFNRPNTLTTKQPLHRPAGLPSAGTV